MTDYARYAAVVTFAARPVAGGLEGYAAPARGQLPAAVALYGGNRRLATFAATAFSDEARDAGLRHGWCGFRAANVGEAFALADDVSLRCLVSDEVLARPEIGELDIPVPTQMTVDQIIAFARRGSCASDVEQLLPFVEVFRSRVGAKEFGEKLFSMLMNRPIPYEEGLRMFNIKNSDPSAVVLKKVVNSRHCKGNALSFIPGPFHPDFMLGREGFGPR